MSYWTAQPSCHMDCLGIYDTHQPHNEAFSKASGLTPTSCHVVTWKILRGRNCSTVY